VLEKANRRNVIFEALLKWRDWLISASIFVLSQTALHSERETFSTLLHRRNKGITESWRGFGFATFPWSKPTASDLHNQ
jgi:hypothetical protein